MAPTLTVAPPRIPRRGWGLAKPSLVDLFFPILLLAAFGRTQSWQALLADGDTGWHIRTGEFILQTGTVPFRDLFSFSRPGEPWFAWEWLADVVFALLHRWHGLGAVAAFSAVVLCGSAVLLLCWLLRRGVGLFIAVAVTLACVSASSVHYLARPHIFSLPLVTLTLWILDEDRRKHTRWVWAMPPLFALWANLHGGFVGGMAVVFLAAAVAAGERRWRAFRHYGVLGVLAGAATLLNPYGWRLHGHILHYLGSSWILDNVLEFQSPRIRSENMLVFAALLLAGVALAGFSFAQGRKLEAALVLAWGFAALRSARHVPLYALAAAPVIASACAARWEAASRRAPARAALRLLWELSRDFGQSCRAGPWMAVLGGAALWMALPRAPLADFPATRFPVAAVAHAADTLAPVARMPRILTSDQWADYLIFRLYPRQRVFFDGRSDFYGPRVGADYQALLSCGPGWRQALDRYGFEAALLPLDWPLGSLLEREPAWRVEYRDLVAVLLVRRNAGLNHAGLKKVAGSADVNPMDE